LYPVQPHRVVDVAKLVDVRRFGGEGAGISVQTCLRSGRREIQPAIPSCHRMNANSSAVSFRLSNRPDLPPWPAPMLVLSSSSASLVRSSRSLATHFAGS